MDIYEAFYYEGRELKSTPISLLSEIGVDFSSRA